MVFGEYFGSHQCIAVMNIVCSGGCKIKLASWVEPLIGEEFGYTYSLRGLIVHSELR
jgi:hypothetical protein